MTSLPSKGSTATLEPRTRTVDEIVFQPSPATTVGVEIELQILDRESKDLAPGAVRILQACGDESLDAVTAELMQSMLEIRTGICRNTTDARDELLPVLRRVRHIATSMGYELALGGTHPFHRTGSSAIFPSERYERIMGRLAWLTTQRVVFGLHVHVGMPSGDMALGVINGLVQYLPHLLALSASSPFWQGVDTGLASCRTALYRMLPNAGVPRYFPKWKDFRTYCRVMRDCRAIESLKDIYWDIRPRPDLGTIEFRICDMPSSIATTLSIVAVIRTLVIAMQRHLEERPHLRRGDIRRHWIAVENKWLATRYGLDAPYIRTPAGKRRPLAHDLNELINRLLPIARESGDDVFLAGLQPVDRLETGAARQRRLYRESGDWRALLDDCTQRLAQELSPKQNMAEASNPNTPIPNMPAATSPDQRSADELSRHIDQRLD